MEACELTILMPCLNEAETLAVCLDKAKSFLALENISGEILIADNGSTDGSQDIARQYGARIIGIDKRGYGAALKGGISAAQGKYIIMGDADDSYDFLQLKDFLAKLRGGADLVMGNRFQGGIVEGAMPFLNRYLGNPVLSLLGRLFFKSDVGDFHCGLRGFRRESIQALNLQGDGMEFASEMVIKATLKKLNITEVPTQLFPDGRSRAPHLRPWRDGWRHLRLLLLLSPRWLFLYPGIFLLTSGMLLMALLLQGPIGVGKVNFDIHSLLFSGFFMIAGAQVVSLAVFARCIADFHLQREVKRGSFLWMLKHFTLERGLTVGSALMLLGGMGACYTFWIWQQLSFGPLLPTHMMRILIPSLTILTIGLQLMFASFFMGLLEMHYRLFPDRA